MTAAVAVAAFFGAQAGVIAALWMVTRYLKRHIDEDPDLGKIEIRVFLNGDGQ